jgi:hypothetical protein
MKINGVLTGGGINKSVRILDTDILDIEEIEECGLNDENVYDLPVLGNNSQDDNEQGYLFSVSYIHSDDAKLELFKEGEKEPFITLSGKKLESHICYGNIELGDIFKLSFDGKNDDILDIEKFSKKELLQEGGITYLISSEFSKNAKSVFEFDVDDFDLSKFYLFTFYLEESYTEENHGFLKAGYLNLDLEKISEKFPDTNKKRVPIVDPDKIAYSISMLDMIPIEISEQGNSKGAEYVINKLPTKEDDAGEYNFDWSIGTIHIASYE